MFDSLRAALSRKKTSPRRRAPAARKPCVEALEGREVPATLTLPQTSVPTFTATFNILEAGNPVQVDEAVAGGNFGGLVNGTTPLTASYCVNLDLALAGTAYGSAAVTADGTIYGAAVPHAGAISWLVANLGPAATTPLQQDALQAAIWRTEYGDGFQLDGVDNADGAPQINSQIAPLYKADLAALGTNTAPVGSVSWISPGANPDGTLGQGLVALTGQPLTTNGGGGGVGSGGGAGGAGAGGSQGGVGHHHRPHNPRPQHRPQHHPKPHHRRAGHR